MENCATTMKIEQQIQRIYKMKINLDNIRINRIDLTIWKSWKGLKRKTTQNFSLRIVCLQYICIIFHFQLKLIARRNFYYEINENYNQIRIKRKKFNCFNWYNNEFRQRNLTSEVLGLVWIQFLSFQQFFCFMFSLNFFFCFFIKKTFYYLVAHKWLKNRHMIFTFSPFASLKLQFTACY